MLHVYSNDITALYYNDYEFFFSKPNVIGIGYGYKFINKINTFEPCIQVFVEKKLPANSLPMNAIIPSLYKCVKTDVIETGRFVCGKTSTTQNSLIKVKAPVYGGRIRPIQPGWSMSTDYSIYACGNDLTGTFGYIVTDNTQVSTTYCLLSVNGTFADWNNYPIGGSILQPSYEYNGRSPNDVVAKLLRYAPLTFRVPDSPAPPLTEMDVIDASVASLIMTEPIQLINPFIPPNDIVPTGITEPELEMNVNWTGCYSGNQSGTITSINAILKVDYFSHSFRHRQCWFKNVSMALGSLSESDVGALVYNETRKALGLVFSNNLDDTHIIICSMQSIEDILKVTLIK